VPYFNLGRGSPGRYRTVPRKDRALTELLLGLVVRRTSATIKQDSRRVTHAVRNVRVRARASSLEVPHLVRTKKNSGTHLGARAWSLSALLHSHSLAVDHLATPDGSATLASPPVNANIPSHAHAAKSIMRVGFRNGPGTYIMAKELFALCRLHCRHSAPTRSGNSLNTTKAGHGRDWARTIKRSPRVYGARRARRMAGFQWTREGERCVSRPATAAPSQELLRGTPQTTSSGAIRPDVLYAKSTRGSSAREGPAGRAGRATRACARCAAQRHDMRIKP
jgi:hypothetical protein